MTKDTRKPSTEYRAAKARAWHVFLFTVAVAIALQLAFAVTFYYRPGPLTELFHLEIEKNVPSTYSALLLISAAVAAFSCTRAATNERVAGLPARYGWSTVGLLLLLMAADEYLSFHERADLLMVKLGIIAPGTGLALGGYAWAWVMVGLPFALAIGIPMVFWFNRILSAERYLFYLLVGAGFVFLLGAVGMEGVQVYWNRHNPENPLTVAMMIEEFLEMLGASLALFALMRYRAEMLRANAARTSAG
jgi:hypothetical protein